MFYDYLMHCVAINYVSFLPMRYYYKWCLKSICLRVHRFYRPFSTRRWLLLRPGGGRWFCFGLNRSWPRESSPLYFSTGRLHLHPDINYEYCPYMGIPKVRWASFYKIPRLCVVLCSLWIIMEAGLKFSKNILWKHFHWFNYSL